MLTLGPEFVYSAASLFAAAIGAAYHLRSRRVPNFVTAPAFVFGLLLHFTLGGWRQLLSAAAASLVCGVIFFLFYLAGGMGGGDVKLIAAIGSVAGLSLVGPVLVLTSVAGGVMALGLALYRRQLKETCRRVGVLVAHHTTAGLQAHPEFNIGNTETLRLPYAVAIAIGCALSLSLVIVRR